MGAIIAWIKGHIVLDKILKAGKSLYDFKESRHKAALAEIEARRAAKHEKLENLELAMYKLDGKVRQDHGWSVRIVDPNIYVEELKTDCELVDAVLMKRASEMRTPQVPDRWRRNW